MNVDTSKPLSEKVIADLRTRLPLATVEYYIALASNSEAQAPSEPAGGEVASDGFDPSEHNVSEVQEYLLTADEAETERVLAAETAGQGRKGILES